MQVRRLPRPGDRSDDRARRDFHSLAFLIANVNTALLAAALVAALELVAISLIRKRFPCRVAARQPATGRAQRRDDRPRRRRAWQRLAPSRMATIRVVEVNKHCCKGNRASSGVLWWPSVSRSRAWRNGSMSAPISCTRQRSCQGTARMSWRSALVEVEQRTKAKPLSPPARDD